jgi:hypothetical protein
MVFREFVKHVPIPHKSCPSHHQFYPLLELEHSEQWHVSSDLLWHPVTNKLNPHNCWYDYPIHKKKLYLIHDSHSSFLREMCILQQCWYHRPPIWLPALSLNLTYLDSSLETVIREPTLYKFFTFHNPNLMSIFLRLSRLSKESVQVRSSLMTFVTNLFFYGEGLLAPCPTPQAAGPPLVVCPQLLIQYIRNYPP